MNVRYRVDLSQAERDELSALVSGGKQPVRRLKRMQILLAADAGVATRQSLPPCRPAILRLFVARHREAGGPAVEGFRKVLLGMMKEVTRQWIDLAGAWNQVRR